VIYDEATGNPIAVVMEVAPGQVFATTSTERNFNTVLKNLGINKTLIQTEAQLPRVTDFDMG
jgi:hypothetical protein